MFAIFCCDVFQALSRSKHFCVSDHDETYFDFSCVGDKAPSVGTSDYTICGTPYHNKAEYVVIVSAACVLGFATLFQCLCNSGPPPLTSHAPAAYARQTAPKAAASAMQKPTSGAGHASQGQGQQSKPNRKQKKQKSA